MDSLALLVTAAPTGSTPRSTSRLSPRSFLRYRACPPMVPTFLSDRSSSRLDLGRGFLSPSGLRNFPRPLRPRRLRLPCLPARREPPGSPPYRTRRWLASRSSSDPALAHRASVTPFLPRDAASSGHGRQYLRPSSCPRRLRLLRATGPAATQVRSRRSSKITSKSFSTSTMTDSGPPMVPCTRGSGISSKRTCAAVIYISDSCGSGAVTQTVATRPSGLCRSLERPVGCVRVAGRSAPCSGLSAWSRRSCRTYRTLNSS